MKNHVNGLAYRDGKIIAVPQGYIHDTKEALDEYKKQYSDYWNQVLGGFGDGEIEFTETDFADADTKEDEMG